MDVSNFQVVGLFAGGVFVVAGARKLRIESDDPLSAIGLLLTGLLLALLAVFPGIAGIFSELLALGDFKGSRLIALLIVGLVVLWVIVISMYGRVIRLNHQIDRYVRKGVVHDFFLSNNSSLDGCVLCIVPALNEEANLRELLPRFPDQVAGNPILVLIVNDGSTDDTAEVGREYGALVADVPVNRGQGGALRTGFDIARIGGAEVVVTIDADGQNDPEDVPLLVEPILENEADVIIGSRILGEHEVTVWWRHVGVIVFSKLINLLMGTRITDCSSGYRAVRTTLLSDLRLQQDQYHTSEFLILAAKKPGVRIEERPITFRRRISGKSKKGNEILYAFRFMSVLMGTWLRGR